MEMLDDVRLLHVAAVARSDVRHVSLGWCRLRRSSQCYASIAGVKQEHSAANEKRGAIRDSLTRKAVYKIYWCEVLLSVSELVLLSCLTSCLTSCSASCAGSFFNSCLETFAETVLKQFWNSIVEVDDEIVFGINVASVLKIMCWSRFYKLLLNSFSKSFSGVMR